MKSSSHYHIILSHSGEVGLYDRMALETPLFSWKTSPVFEELLDKQPQDSLSLVTIRNFGTELFNSFFPEETHTVFDLSEKGSLLFSISRSYSNFNPDLLCKNNSFLFEHFSVGSLYEETTKALPIPMKQEFFTEVSIIADPTNTLNQAKREAHTIKKMFSEKGSAHRFIAQGTAEKIHRIMTSSSFVHFAGHSEFTKDDSKSGWLLKDKTHYTINDIKRLNKEVSTPSVIFSNSCYASGSGNLAQSFLDNGVSVFIGPSIRIQDTVAEEFAKTFYRNLLEKNFLLQSVNLCSLFTDTKIALFNSNKEIYFPLFYRYFGDPLLENKKSRPRVRANLISRRGFKVATTITIVLLTLFLFKEQLTPVYLKLFEFSSKLTSNNAKEKIIGKFGDVKWEETIKKLKQEQLLLDSLPTQKEQYLNKYIVVDDFTFSKVIKKDNKQYFRLLSPSHRFIMHLVEYDKRVDQKLSFLFENEKGDKEYTFQLIVQLKDLLRYKSSKKQLNGKQLTVVYSEFYSLYIPNHAMIIRENDNIELIGGSIANQTE